VTGISREDLDKFRAEGSWRALEIMAQRMAADVSEKVARPFQPLLGGGTRLMLALNHRISHDIDLFFTDAQWIGYLTPRLNDCVEAMTADYDEAADYLKLRFPEGEIDFIVRTRLLNLPPESAPDTTFALDPIPEVLAKKLFFRGATLTPRDLFDWWAIETMQPGVVPVVDMGRLLEKRAGGIRLALDSMGKSPRSQRIWEAILAPSIPSFTPTIDWATDQLGTYLAARDKHR
jgi:hypothetical protein